MRNWLVLFLGAILIGCGGGNSASTQGSGAAPAAGPTITSFSVSPSPVFVGQAVTLMASFSGGSGSIDNGVGPVQSGVAKSSTPLSRPTNFTLTVTDGAITVRKSVLVNVADGVFQPVSSMLAPRSWHTATLLQDGRVLIAGGLPSGGGAGLPDAEIYDPATRTFKAVGPMVVNFRSRHTATLLNDGRVLIDAGWRTLWDGGPALAEVFDPATESFSAVPGTDGGMGLEGASATLLKDGRVLFAGGGNISIFQGLAFFDPVSGTFSPAGAMNSPRASHTATLLSDGRVIFVGGYGGNGVFCPNAEVFDPATGICTVVDQRSTTRGQHGAALLADGRVLVGGGFMNGSLASAELFDSVSSRFTTVGNLPEPAEDLSFIALASGKILSTGSPQASIFDPATAKFAPVSGASMAPRAAAVRLRDGSVLVTGGIDSSGHPLSTAVVFVVGAGSGSSPVW